jgi:hypothetical protein
LTVLLLFHLLSSLRRPVSVALYSSWTALMLLVTVLVVVLCRVQLLLQQGTSHLCHQGFWKSWQRSRIQKHWSRS